MTAPLKVGSRGSALAMHQTRTILAALQGVHPDLRAEIVEIKTVGDRFRDVPITEMGQQVDRGIFNSALEEAVLAGKVDFATCSFKDVESDLPAGLTAVPVLPREDARDVLVTRHRTPLAGLPQGAVLATSSPRRTSQLKAFRPDFRFEPLRGNITTRVEKDPERFDGVVLAAAGLLRLGLKGHVSDWIGEEVLVPAPAQGALGCEFRSHRADLAALMAAIGHGDTERCVRLEKRVMVLLSGGCYAPIGVHARVEGGRLRARCRIVSLDGKERAEGEVSGDPARAEALAEELAGRLADQGGREIIARTRAAMGQPADGDAP